MDIRTTANPVVRAAGRGLARFNTRHPWSHNDHFHGWLLRRLPEKRRAALDVGCGRGGLLSRLASEFEAVHGTDVDAGMRAAATAACAGRTNVTVGAEQLTDLTGPYDALTMVAVLHHLDEAAALADVRRLLAPGGRLLVVGLARPDSRTDLAVDVVSALANPVVGMVKHPRAFRGEGPPEPFPVRDPELTFDELASLSGDLLPGRRIRRRLFFRHTMEWTAPR